MSNETKRQPHAATVQAKRVEPHAAMVARGNAVQPKLAKKAPGPHPATMLGVAVLPKVVQERASHRAAPIERCRKFGEGANDHADKDSLLIQNKEKLVIQRITEEDARQANFTFSSRATEHGYTQQQLQTIMQHRFSEINAGSGRSMLIGQGLEEGYGVYGQILYNCTLRQDGIYNIHIYHAHGHGRMG